MIRRNKVADTNPLGLIMGSILLSLIFGLSLCSLSKGGASVIHSTDKVTTQQMLDACLALRNEEVKGLDSEVCYNCDSDGDGLKDFCDNCPKMANYGENVADPDGDLFPTGCCGNDGHLSWEKDENGEFTGVKEESLPCKRSASIEEKSGTKYAEEGTGESYHPVYKNIPSSSIAFVDSPFGS